MRRRANHNPGELLAGVNSVLARDDTVAGGHFRPTEPEPSAFGVPRSVAEASGPR